MKVRLLSVFSESIFQRSTRINGSPSNYNLPHYFQDKKVVNKKPVRGKIGLKATSDKSNCHLCVYDIEHGDV